MTFNKEDLEKLTKEELIDTLLEFEKINDETLEELESLEGYYKSNYNVKKDIITAIFLLGLIGFIIKMF